MPTLSCNATNCIHNMSSVCSANDISVIGSGAYSSLSTNCETFAEKGIRNSIYSISNFNVTGQMMQMFNSSSVYMSPAITCLAENCRYNSNSECTASNVQITGIGALTNSRTHCDTFIR